jgi:hypothetical protein
MNINASITLSALIEALEMFVKTEADARNVSFIDISRIQSSLDAMKTIKRIEHENKI